jgi:outer membrane protein assembly factor BamA
VKFDDPNTPHPNDFALFTSSRLKSSLAEVGLTFVGDTLRYNPWGPWQGKRFNIEATTAPFASGGAPATFTDYSFDYRAYRKLSYRSLIAWRAGGLLTQGKGATLFGIGGFNQLRGFRYREFIGDRAIWSNLEMRFPLVDDLHFPFGSIRWIRALLFFDIGAAWTQEGYFFDRQLGKVGVINGSADPNSFAELGAPGIFRDFKFWDADKHALRDARASYGTGFSFRLGVLDLNWVFAKQLPYERINLDGKIAQGVTCRQGIVDQFNLKTHPVFSFEGFAAAINACGYEKTPTSNWKSEFYIGYEF